MTEAITMTTAIEFLSMPATEERTELVRGEIVRESPAGWRHGCVGLDLASEMRAHVRARGLGRVVAADTGFWIGKDPDTVRAPDCAFVSRERAASVTDDQSFAALAPDLIAEVLSPSDRAGKVREKIADWLAAGTRVALVVDPLREAIFVHRANAPVEILAVGDVLRLEDVLPGFALPLADLFAR